MKVSAMGAVGMVAGVMLGTAAGYALKSMMPQKTKSAGSMVSSALGTMGEMFTGLSKHMG
ncbi:MAG: hypothetical protein IJZ33_07165 [Clostridia bacterium]|nr:hypothetical protein [Clostridia bacterium]